jgi:hypothetical protein
LTVSLRYPVLPLQGQVREVWPVVSCRKGGRLMRLHGPYAFIGLIAAIVIIYLLLRLAGLL